MVLNLPISECPKKIHFHMTRAPGFELLDPCAAVLGLLNWLNSVSGTGTGRATRSKRATEKHESAPPI